MSDIYEQLAGAVMAEYAKNFPTAKQTAAKYTTIAEKEGEIRTILNRAARFDRWGPLEGFDVPLDYDAAVSRYTYVKRAFGHKALNRLLQGSAADLMKKAMLNLYESGLLDEIGMPHLTVHDELDWSVPNDKLHLFEEVIQCMQDAVKLEVPVIADTETGPDWGHVK